MMLAKNTKKQLRRQHQTGLNNRKALTVTITEMSSVKFKKVFSNERDTMIAPLKCTKGLCSTATENRSTHVHPLQRKTF